MFEAKLLDGGILKKVLDAVKDLLTEATFDCKCGCVDSLVYQVGCLLPALLLSWLAAAVDIVFGIEVYCLL